MARHDNAVHAGVHHGVGVLDRLDAFEHDGAVPVLAQEREVFSSAERARVGLSQPPDAERERLARLLVSRRETRPERVPAVRLPLHKDGVRRADPHADARGKREVRGVEHVWAPAENEAVHLDDERCEARCLGIVLGSVDVGAGLSGVERPLDHDDARETIPVSAGKAAEKVGRRRRMGGGARMHGEKSQQGFDGSCWQ